MHKLKLRHYADKHDSAELLIALDNISGNYPVIKAFRYRLWKCSESLNTFVASGDDDKPFLGRYWRCNSIVCPSCARKRSARTRRVFEKRISEYKPNVGTQLNFVTLTMPRLRKDFVTCYQVLNRAWRLFTKRRFFSRCFEAGAKSVEFTISKTGYHFHIHSVAYTRYIDYTALRITWTECVEASFREHRIKFEPKTADKLCICNVKRCDANVSKELCKYLTKPQQWKELPPKDLKEIIHFAKLIRGFEFYGQLRSKTILDTRCVNAADNKERLISTASYGWRELACSMDFTVWREQFDRKVERARENQREILSDRYFHFPIEWWKPDEHTDSTYRT